MHFLLVIISDWGQWKAWTDNLIWEGRGGKGNQHLLSVAFGFQLGTCMY